MFRIYFLIPLLIPLAFMKRDFSFGIFPRLEGWAGRISVRPWRAVAAVAIVSLLLCMGLSVPMRIPPPQVADEFGYLLLGDTFAHGRITNPSPPLWEHFETIHEIMQPTYTAKYPPAQGVALAAGEKLGLPILGVWLTTALACAAICWMFMAWMPPRWALAGGLMVAFHPKILEWSQNYWGGAVAMGGGALVLGAFRRILRTPRVRDSMWLAVGLAVLANSRPFEGFVLANLVLLALLVWFGRAGKLLDPLVIGRVYTPLLAFGVLLALQLGLYNWQVTGNPAVMPYVVHEETYGIAPLFLFGKVHQEPQFRHVEIRKMQEEYRAYFESQIQSFGSLVRSTADKIWTLCQAYLWSYLMIIALLGLPWALRRDRWLRFALIIGVFFTIFMLMGTWVFSHYAAPAAGLFFVLVVESMRMLHAWRVDGRPVGRNLVRGLAVLFVISYFQIAYKLGHQEGAPWPVVREKMIASLEHEPGKSLVIVRYEPGHNPNREWIYNEADIPGAKVILARDMGAQNKELLAYYQDRKAWVIDADAPKPELEPYLEK